MRIKESILAAAILSVSCASAAKEKTEVKTYTFDIPHTQVHLTVNHLGFSNSTGRMKLKSGTIELNEADLSKSKVSLTMDIASLDYGDKTWNEHMLDSKFFNVKKFPTAQFESTEITMSDDKRGTLVGDITILGVKNPIKLDFVINKLGQNPFSKKPYLGVSASGSLTRSDFGMKAYVPSVGDDVALRIEAEAVAK
jgi:polyisoprenoid-binding protein YceI